MKNLFTVIAMVVVLGVAGYVACGDALAGTARMALVICGPILGCAIFGALLLQRQEMLRPLLTFRPGDFTRGFVAAAICFVAVFGATRFVFPIGSNQSSWLLRIYLQLGDPKELRYHLPFVIAALLIAAVSEEVVYRGLLPYLLEGYVGSRRAWLYSVAIYAVAQMPTAYALRTPAGGLNPLLPLAALGCGLVWGYLTRRTERLWPAIVSHALFDWAVVMMFRLYGPSV